MGDSHQRGGLVGPLLLVGFGVALLGSNLGWFSESLWRVLLRAWPVVLMAVGIDLLIPRRSAVGTLVAALLIAAVLGGGLWLAATGAATAPASTSEAVQVPLQAPRSAEVEIRPAVGQLRVSAGSASGGLVEATIPLMSGERLERRVDQVGDRQRVLLRSDGVFLLPSTQGVGLPWEVRLNPVTPMGVEVGMGVGEIQFDGKGLALSRLGAELGVGQIELRLGPGIESVDASLGIGDLTIVVPARTGVRIEANVALGSRNLPAGFVRDGDWYLSPGYATAAETIEIRASVAIGEIRLRNDG